MLFWSVLFIGAIIFVLYLSDRYLGTNFIGFREPIDKPQEFHWSRAVTIEYGDSQSLVREFKATDNYVYYTHLRGWYNESFSEDVMDHAHDFVRRVVTSGCKGNNGRWIMPNEITGIVVSEVIKTPV